MRMNLLSVLCRAEGHKTNLAAHLCIQAFTQKNINVPLILKVREVVFAFGCFQRIFLRGSNFFDP
jgi:hypothetical protein